MSLLFKSLNLTFTRSFVSARSLHPTKFTSILKNVPVKPRNQWQIYLRENMNSYKKDDGKIDLGGAAKDLSVKWKTLSEAEKAPYVKIFQKEYDEHVKLFDQAINKATPEQFKQENALRRKYNLTLLKDPREPKRPKNAFLFYVEHLRKSNDPTLKDLKVHEQVSEAAKRYNALSSSELKVFNEKANAASEQYKKDYEAYISG